MILDTNALSALADSAPGLTQALAQTEPVLPVIAIGEFRYGIARSRQRRQYEQWLDGLSGRCRVLDITEQTTREYVAVRLQLRQRGKPIPSNDVWIAALCLEHELPLLSRDRHFDDVAGVHRVGW